MDKYKFLLISNAEYTHFMPVYPCHPKSDELTCSLLCLWVIRETPRVDLVRSLRMPNASLSRTLVAWQFHFQVNILFCPCVFAFEAGSLALTVLIYYMYSL